MAAIATESNLSTGDCGQAPTLPVGPMTSSNCTFGGKKILWRGVTVYANHPGLTPHSGLRTIVDPGGSTFFMEGNPVAFEGDSLQDGDKIAPLAGNTSFGG